MAQTRGRRSPRKSKLAERFEKAGFALEETEYDVLPPHGDHFDLRRLLLKVDRAYFGADRPFDLPRVAWAPLDDHNAWAVYVLKDDEILIEKSLDDPSVPQFVIKYLLVHELLHLAHLPSEAEGEPEWHTESFESALAKFVKGGAAEKWLERRLAHELRAKSTRAARSANT